VGCLAVASNCETLGCMNDICGAEARKARVIQDVLVVWGAKTDHSDEASKFFARKDAVDLSRVSHGPSRSALV
jgi:hypothetical protein